MWFVICVLLWVVVVGCWWWNNRNQYWKVETKTTGQIRQQIIRLPLRHIANSKLRHEIKIFNRLCLVMPIVDGVAVVYRQQMKALLRNSRHKPSHDPYERLFYAYACDVLAQKYEDEIVRCHLRRNLTFLLAPRKKIVKKIVPVWSRQKYDLYPLPIYKVFQDGYFDPLQSGINADEPWQRIVAHGSYVKYCNQKMTVKRYAHAYELTASDWQTVTIKVAADKQDFSCTINRCVIMCKHLRTGESHTFAVRGDKVRLATSLCSKIDALEIYVTWQGNIKIGLDGGEARWLTDSEIKANRKLECLVDNAYRAKFVKGEKLRTRYLAASKVVPSLESLTKVVVLKNAEHFLNVWAEIYDYQKVAHLFCGFNLVFIYAGSTTEVEEVVQSTVTQRQLDLCHQNHLWIYFVDRTVVEPDALYFLLKLAEPSHYVPVESTPAGLTIKRTWPYVKTLTVTNNLPQKMTQNLIVPLVFPRLSVVSTRGTVLTVVGLVSGRVSHYALPVVLNMKNEYLTTHLNLPLKVKLAGYETRQFEITRRESKVKSRLTKKDLVTALTDIEIKTDDKKFDAIFKKDIIDGEDASILAAVKAAYQNQDRKLLLVALEDRHQITADVWEYLLTQLVGLRMRAGKIYLTPCVNVMGEFTVSFECMGQQYAFSTKKKLSSKSKFATIKYGNSNG